MSLWVLPRVPCAQVGRKGRTGTGMIEGGAITEITLHPEVVWWRPTAPYAFGCESFRE
jgi:hypothetical protein